MNPITGIGFAKRGLGYGVCRGKFAPFVTKFEGSFFMPPRLEMAEHVCETCGMAFTRPAGLQRHKGRKVPCKVPAELIQNHLMTAFQEAGVGHLSVPTTDFRDISRRFNASLAKDVRLEQGIFFTPLKARDILFQRLAELGVEPKRILEPSFGSGEFLLDAMRLYPGATICGVEKNAELYRAVVDQKLGMELSCGDFMEWDGAPADLIIGNPPYFVLKATTTLAKECMTGRANIYVAFLYKCLKQHLAKDGYLAFVIPTSLFNCSYYQPMRDYIIEHTTIHCLEVLNKPGFFETGQETMLMVLQNNKQHDNFVFRAPNGLAYLSPYYKELDALIKDRKTLKELGFGVKTGNVVWNQVKENLSDEPGKLLVYSSNLVGGELVVGLKGGERKQYVKDLKKPTITGPVILVDRGYGNTFKFNAVLVTEKDFYAENHVNVIYPLSGGSAETLERVMASFSDPRTAEFVKLFVGNGTLSSSDIATNLPIY